MTVLVLGFFASQARAKCETLQLSSVESHIVSEPRISI